MTKKENLSVVMMGATGAVGGEALKHLLTFDSINKITTLGRRTVADISTSHVYQHEIDIFYPAGYQHLLKEHTTAICTLGVGEPSKISKEKFESIDKDAVLDFAKACKASGIKHFELLSSIGINSKSSNFFLRIKGELVDELKKLEFDRLSIFQPSMILTPTNRYGFTQAMTLMFWPIIDKVFWGSLKKYRGVKVEVLGRAIANNILVNHSGIENLTWEDF